jgi:hypothetical protein
MNAKLAKMLRGGAQYRNQSATPGGMPFPGVARLYQHPVFETRYVIKSSYVHLPLMDKPTKVFTTVRRLVLDNKGRPKQVMETQAIGTVPTFDAHGVRNGTNLKPIVKAKTELIPVSKPARLDSQCPKGIYRSLKRLARRRLLKPLGVSLLNVSLLKGATA